MNRGEFERHLRSEGCVLQHHGAKHDVWMDPTTPACVPVPRHRTLKRGTCRGICRILGIPFPK